MFVDDLRYDPRSRVLTIRWSSPSRVARAAYQYRDVDPSLAAQLEQARPHVGRLIASRVTPEHAIRRLGQSEWRAADAGGHGEPTVPTPRS